MRKFRVLVLPYEAELGDVVTRSTNVCKDIGGSTTLQGAEKLLEVFEGTFGYGAQTVVICRKNHGQWEVVQNFLIKEDEETGALDLIKV